MIAIVAHPPVEFCSVSRYMVATDRAVIQVETAEEALEIVAHRAEDAAPMVTFVPDLEQLSDLLTRLESWPEISAIILFGAIGSNLKRFSDHFKNEWIKSSPIDFF